MKKVNKKIITASFVAAVWTYWILTESKTDKYVSSVSEDLVYVLTPWLLDVSQEGNIFHSDRRYENEFLEYPEVDDKLVMNDNNEYSSIVGEMLLSDFNRYEVMSWNWLFAISNWLWFNLNNEEDLNRFLKINNLSISDNMQLKHIDWKPINAWDVFYYNSSFNLWYIWDYFDISYNKIVYNKFYELEKEEEFDELLLRNFYDIVNKTLSVSKNDANPVAITYIEYSNLLERKLNSAIKEINYLENKYEVRQFLVSKIDLLAKHIDYPIRYDTNLDDLFDIYSTLERISVTRKFFSHLEAEEFYEIADKKWLANIITWLRLKRAVDFDEFSEENYLLLRPYIEYLISENIDNFPTNDVNEMVELYLWLIMQESKYHIFNVSNTWVIWIAMTTAPVYLWNYSWQSNDKINPFNPYENLQRSLEYLIFLYWLFNWYNKEWYHIHDIVLTAYNRWQWTVWNALSNYWINWKESIDNAEWRNYYNSIISSYRDLNRLVNYSPNNTLAYRN